jgi:hypothetical protein
MVYNFLVIDHSRANDPITFCASLPPCPRLNAAGRNQLQPFEPVLSFIGFDRLQR